MHEYSYCGHVSLFMSIMFDCGQLQLVKEDLANIF